MRIKGYCEWCPVVGPCGICGQGLRAVSPWGDRARRLLAWLVDGAALVALAVVSYFVASCQRGTP